MSSPFMIENSSFFPSIFQSVFVYFRIPRTFALPNRTEAGDKAAEKENSNGSWFLKKAPYLCTPPESIGFMALKAHFRTATKVEK